MFISKTFDDLVTDAIVALASQPGPITDFSQGSTAYTLVRAFMSVLARGYVDLDEALISSFISTASGDYLTRHADAFGVVRNTGSLSVGQVVAIAKVGAVPTNIPAGTLILVEGAKFYRNTASVVLTPPNTQVPIEATAIGDAYDLPAGTQLLDNTGALNATWDFLVATNGLDVNGDPTGFLTGGSDAETDDQLRTRFIEFINSLSRSTERAVRTAIAGVPGVESFVLKEFDPGVGWFTVYVDDGSDTTDPVLLAQVRQVLDDTKALGIGYRVLPMQKLFVDMTITLTIGGLVAAQPIIDAVKQQLRTVLNQYTFGEKLTVAKIVSVCMSVPGVVNVTVADPTGEIDPGVGVAVRPGVLNVTAVI